jgi:hypothetical protein
LNIKLAALQPVVRLPTDLFFYRVHDNRQTGEQAKNNMINYLNYQVTHEALLNERCPLTSDEIEKALRTLNKLQARRAIKNFVTNRNINFFKEIIVESKMGWTNFFKGLFTTG